MTNVRQWYESSYKKSGFEAQRRYPNEELLRFLGANFFDKNVEDRKNIKVLEVGCGSCSNLWMIAKEGFDTYGLDLSDESLVLGKQTMDNWRVSATLKQGSFLELPYKGNEFDIVIDVFSLNCVNHNEFLMGLDEVHRVLKKGGVFFSYTPSQRSGAFKIYKPANKIDSYTLSGIFREDSPFSGNHYPFHFWGKEDYKESLTSKGFSINYLETVERSYYKSKEKFEHIIVYAKK